MKLLLTLLIFFLTPCLAEMGTLAGDNGNTENTAEKEPPKIVLNQVGYLPDWQKVAFIVQNSDTKLADFAEIITVDKNWPVYTSSISVAKKDTQSNDYLSSVDFSELKQPGKYRLRVGEYLSPPFEINTQLFNAPVNLLLRSYYLQRCGIALDDKITKIQHAVCHHKDNLIANDDTLHKSGDSKEALGGWHDAGDYGKYVSTTAVSAGLLLSLYEKFPEHFSDNQWQIPESGNGIPDLLDEVKIGLDWMLKMQRSDGAVYRKLAGKKWPSKQAPDDDVQQRYLYGITTTDTAKAAAAWALAGRLYKTVLPEAAEIYLKAAKQAWSYLKSHPDEFFDYREGDNGGSGPYMSNSTDTEESLKYDWDDRLWAAVELFITTQEPEWENYANSIAKKAPLNLYEWKDPSALALSHYLFNPKMSDKDNLKPAISKKIIDRANTSLENMKTSGYRVANTRFIWGSNKMTAEEGVFLVYAYKLTQDRRYYDAAAEQLHYLLGRNHFNQTFVSGLGANPVKHVSHIFTRAKGIDIPGLFVGGPNTLAQAKIAPKNKGILSYIDHARSYATNEYAIDYNASLISLISWLTFTSTP